MTKETKLYTETLMRVGPQNMAGIDSLLEQGHTGIAEKHAVQKLVTYIENLESQLGIDTERLKQQNLNGKIIVNEAGRSYLL